MTLNAPGALAIEPELTRPRRIYVIGESNCLAYKDILCKTAAGDYGFQTRYIIGLKAGEMFDSTRGLSFEIVSALKDLELIDSAGEAVHRSARMDVQANIFAAGLPLVAPVIVFVAGDIDLRSKVYPILADEADFIPSITSPYTYDTSKPVVPFDIVRAELNSIVDGMASAARAVQTIYEARVVVEAVNPPTRDEERFSRINGYRCPYVIRYKIAWIYNHLLEEKCREVGVGFTTVWPQCAPDGFLEPRFELDGTHLAASATPYRAASILDAVARDSTNKTNQRRYQMIPPRAANRSAVSGSDPLAKQGYVSFKTQYRHRSKSWRFTEKSKKNLPPLDRDWVCGRRYANEIRVRALEERELKSFCEALSQDMFTQIVRDALHGDPLVIGLRVVTLLRVCPADVIHDTVAPPAPILRGAMAIHPCACVASPADGGPDRPVILSQGEGVIYDPRRVHLTPVTGGDLIEFVLLPRLAGQAISFIASGLNEWPADPFHYSLDGMAVESYAATKVFSASSIVFSKQVNGEDASDYLQERILLN